VTRFITPAAAALLVLLACSAGLSSCSDGCGGRTVINPPEDFTARKQELVQRAAEVRERFASGQPDALEACRQLGTDALVLPDDEVAAEVAWIYIEQARHGDALAYIHEAEAVYTSATGHKALLFPMAAALDATGKPAEAARIYSQALAIEPTNPFEYAGAANLWVAADEFDRASETIESGLRTFPDFPVLLQTRAEIALRRGNTSDALEQLDALAAQAPEDVNILLLQMEALAVLGRWGDVRNAARAFGEAYPILGFGPVFEGLAASKLGESGTAEAAWQQAEEIIAECEVCSGDEADVLSWAREQAVAEAVQPMDR